jgi:DNA polymerase-3 subunit epsilon
MSLLGWVRERVGARGAWARVSLEEVRFTVLDTELTGLDDLKDDIVSIGALHMQGGLIPLGDTFQELVKPRASLDGNTVVVHRITPSQLEEMPPIQAVLDPLLAYVEGTVLVGHYVALDLAFLNRELRRWKGAPLKHRAVDTLSLFGWLRRRQVDHPALQLELHSPSLFDLARAFEIPVEAAHTALGDAYVTAQLLQRLLPLLAQAGIEDLGGLCRAGDPRRQAEHLGRAGGHGQF